MHICGNVHFFNIKFFLKGLQDYCKGRNNY